MTVNVWAVVGVVVGNLPMEAFLGTADQLLGMNNGASAVQYKNVTFNNATGQLAVPAGTAAVPSVSFTGDLDTGVYQDGADAVGITAGGVRRLRVSPTLIALAVAAAMSGAQFREDKAADIASGAAIDLGAAAGNYVYITHAAGNTSIADLGGATVPAGTCIETKFVVTGGALTLVHSANAMVLFGAVNLSVGNGTLVRWRKTNDAAAYWEMVSIQPTSPSSLQVNAANFGFLPGATSAVNKLALQAAIDAIGTTIGGEVLVPVGAYNCDAGIIVPQANTTITGVGLGSGYARPEAGTTITFTATGGPIGFDLTAINGPGGAGNYSCLRNLSIKGNGVLGTGVKASGYVILEHMTVSGCITRGIDLFNSINQALLFDVASVENTGAYGIVVGDPTGATGGANTTFQFIHCTFRQNLVGMRITNARHARFTNCVIESNTNAGLEIYQYTGGRVEFLTFDTCWMEENYAGGAAGYGLKIDSQTRDLADGPSDHIKFVNCAFVNTAPTDAAEILSVKYLDFENCEFGPTEDIVLGAWASYVTFKNRQGGVILDSSTGWNFTPTVTFGGAAAGVTYGAQIGRWRQDGELVHFSLRLTLTSNGTSAGQFSILGLPVAAAPATTGFAGVEQAVSVYANNLTGVAGGYSAVIGIGGTSISVFYNATGTAVALSDTTVTDTADFIISGIYRVAP